MSDFRLEIAPLKVGLHRKTEALFDYINHIEKTANRAKQTTNNTQTDYIEPPLSPFARG